MAPLLFSLEVISKKNFKCFACQTRGKFVSLPWSILNELGPQKAAAFLDLVYLYFFSFHCGVSTCICGYNDELCLQTMFLEVFPSPCNDFHLSDFHLQYWFCGISPRIQRFLLFFVDLIGLTVSHQDPISCFSVDIKISSVKLSRCIAVHAIQSKANKLKHNQISCNILHKIKTSQSFYVA